MCVCACTHVLCECRYTGVMCGLHVEVREQLCGIAPLHLYTDSGTLNSGSQANAYLLSLLPHPCDCYLDQHQIVFWVLGPDHCFLDGPRMLIEMFVHNAYCSHVLRESNSNLGFRINHFDDSFCLGVMPSEVLPIRKELGFLGDVSSPWTHLKGPWKAYFRLISILK